MTREDDYMEYFRNREKQRLEAIRKLTVLYPEHKDYIMSKASLIPFINGKLKIPDSIKAVIKYRDNGN